MGIKDLKITEEDFKGRNIQSIEENIVSGRAEELKRLFDAPAQEVLKEKVNALIEYLATTEAGGEIGTPEISEGSGKTVAEQLSFLFREMQDVSAGSIADGSVEDSKLSNEKGQIKQNVADLNEVIEVLKEIAPHNSIVRWNSSAEFDGEDDNVGTIRKVFEYIAPEIGACHIADAEEDPKFGILPMECGGTGYAGLADAPKSAFIVKRVSDSGRNYLGYVTAEQAASTIGAVPATRKVNGKALSSNVTLTAEDFTINTTVSGTEFADIVGSPSVTVRYNHFCDACFVRIYCTVNGSDITKSEWQTIATIPSEYKPSARHALSITCAVDTSAIITSEGNIQIRVNATPVTSAEYLIYISGFWMV